MFSILSRCSFWYNSGVKLILPLLLLVCAPFAGLALPPDTQYPPAANEWGMGSVAIAGWTFMGSNVCPELGFVAGRPSPGGVGHCGIVDYDGWTISARENGMPRNAKRMLDGKCGYNKPEVTNGSGNAGNE